MKYAGGIIANAYGNAVAQQAVPAIYSGKIGDICPHCRYRLHIAWSNIRSGAYVLNAIPCGQAFHPGCINA